MRPCAAAAVLLLVAGGAAAHPHGRLGCQVQLGFEQGRLELSLQLAPLVPVPAAAQWALACRDPVWYWVGEFVGPAAVSAAGTACRVALEGPRDAAAVAAALTAAARAAGALGAEQVAPAATATAQLGAGRAELRC